MEFPLALSHFLRDRSMQIQSQHRVAVFDSSVIALDTKKGRYLLYDAATGRELAASFFDREVTNFERLFPLVEDGVLVEDNEQGNGRIFDYRNRRYLQFSSEIWSSRNLSGWGSKKIQIRLLSQLVWRAASLHLRGFKALNKLERIHSNSLTSHNEEYLRQLEIPERFRNASLWSPFKIACLQMSYAIAYEYRRQGIDAQLVIGVRSLPFVAHAWVEIEGTVWGDEPNLPSLYGELYRVPEN